jgi:alpha-2-macroglobulin
LCNILNFQVNEEIEIEIRATSPFKTVNYQLLGRGDLAASRVLVLGSSVTRTTFRIRVPALASPQATLICYIVHEGEVVADSLNFHVAGAIDNFLNMTLSTKELEPGKEVEILLMAKPNSLIGLKGIDQSVLLLKEDKDFSINSLEKELNSWNFAKEDSYRYKRSLYSHIGSSTAAKVFEVFIKAFKNSKVFSIFNFSIFNFQSLILGRRSCDSVKCTCTSAAASR